MNATLVVPERYNASSVLDRNIAAGRADKTAIIAEDATLTYGELRQQVNRMGHLLLETGVRREDRVLLVLDDTTVFPIAFLGAMRIGAVPVPVSSLDKAANFRHFIEDSYAEVVVTDAPTLPRLQEAVDGLDLTFLVRGGHGPGIRELDEALAAQSDILDPSPTHRDDPGFWLYSSGSTGKPKGVVHLQHDIEVTCETYARQVLRIRENDVLFSTTKLFHAYGLGNGLSFPLWFGATSVLMSGPTKPEPILETLRRHRPTVFFSVPALYGAILRDPSVGDALESVRLCASAAEALPPTTLSQWKERFGLDIVDGIGSTEMLHIYCSNAPERIEPGTTGRAVPGYELRIVDEAGVPLDGAAVGVLEVRGDSCAAFYWHQHEKTKRCMRGDWFSTGDRYERRSDGAFLYVGRNDDMVKVGGLWVSPVDMENVLISHPRVLGVGVIGTNIDGLSRLAAYIECDGEGDEELAEELRALCKQHLRRYEFPHEVRFVDALPRTLNGKVQRFRLRELAE